MGIYDMNGWQGGPRRPITYNLRPGQMRGMGKVQYAPNQTVINNIFNGYGNSYGMDCCNNSNSSIPKWMQWTMGIGGAMSAVGTFMAALGGNEETEGAGGEKKTGKTTNETTSELSKQEQARKTLDSIGLTKKDGYEVLADEDGNLIYRYTDPNDPTNPIDAKNLKELMNLCTADEKKAAKEVKAENKTQTEQTEQTEKTETITPRLFTDMTGLDSEEEVLAKYKEVTGADAVKIGDISADSITLSSVSDKGNNTNMAGTLNIKTADLKGIELGKTKSLGTFQGKAVVAENLDGYIRIKVGDEQTYIVGKAFDGSYKGFQATGLAVDGTGVSNWHGSVSRTHPTKQHR